MSDAVGRQPYVFISYASADGERVLPLVERLEAAGVKTWIDRDGIHGGANYAQVINDAIEGSVALVLFASPASLASRNVKQELALGWRYEKSYLPLLLDPVTIPGELAYWLEGSQWIELVDRPEQAWLGDVAKALQHFGIAVTPPGIQQPRAPRERPLMVGREREQDVLRKHLDAMLSGRGSVVLVGGEAGIGKTTLVEDLSAQAEEQGALTLWGHAYDLSVTPPYGPWLEIFRQYRSLGAGLPPTPAFVGNAEALARVGSQDALFAAVADFLDSVATTRPMMLVLDDLHWADQSSLDLFRVLARQIADQPILLVATYRTDELTRRHPLYQHLPLLVRESRAERLELHPLDAMEHRALIQQRYSLTETDRVRLERYLTERAEGNPLYAVELLRTLEEEHALTWDGECWTLGDLERVQVPRLLMQVIEGRLARLNEETRSLLQVAAVIGQEVPLELWQQVSEAGDEVLVAAIEEGQGARLVVEVAGGQSVQFRHALLREALYQEVVVLRRRLWHRQVGEALAGQKRSDPDAVAHHFQQAGDRRAAEWLLNAGERAQAAYSWVTAAERFDAALAMLSEQDAPASDRAVLLFRIATLTRFVNPHRALRLMRDARRLAEEAGQGGLAAWSLHQEGLYQCYGGDIRSGLETMEQGARAWERLTDGERETLAASVQRPELADAPGLMFGTVVLWLGAVGPLRKAVDLGERRIAAIPEPEFHLGQNDSVYADGWVGLARSYALLGEPRKAQQALARALAIFRAIEHHTMVVFAYEWEFDLLQLPFFADQPAEQLRNLAAEAGIAVRKASEANPEGLPEQWVALPIMLLQGDWGEATAVATRTCEVDIVSRGSMPGKVLGHLAWERGDRARATSVINLVFPSGAGTEPGNARLATALPLQRLAAHMALDSHDIPTARARLEAHDRWLGWSGAVLGRAEGALGWGQYYLAHGDAFSARSAAEQALAHATDPRQPLALIAVQRFLGRLDVEARQFDSAEDHLRQSLHLSDACQARFERALTLLEFARLRAAQHRTDAARELLAEVRSICETLGARPTLERAEALARELGGEAKIVDA